MKRLIALVVLTELGGCGSVAVLKPEAGRSLPPKPLTATAAPDAAKLIKPSDQARPQRNDDVLRQSEVRTPDRFDLPPPG
jgi:hypothetical protein